MKKTVSFITLLALTYSAFAQANSNNAKPTLNRAGYLTGYIIAAIILTALIVGILFMLKKTFYNKKV
jgi:hypothetical protein